MFTSRRWCVQVVGGGNDIVEASRTSLPTLGLCHAHMTSQRLGHAHMTLQRLGHAHMTSLLPFNLLAVSGHFPAQGLCKGWRDVGRLAETWVGRERRG